MKKVNKRWIAACVLLLAFVLWTILISLVDVRPIGPEGSSVGFAGWNQLVHKLTGVHFLLYHITDWLGLVPFGICGIFGVLGLVQWIKRKSICKVDHSILVLGGFYVVTIAAYLLFENVVINYRPVLIEGVLEVSYPSSTTMLTMCVMPTAIMQCDSRIKNQKIRKVVSGVMWAFTVFMVVGRLISGVHWISDIVGGALLSAGLVMMYTFMADACCDSSVIL